MKTTLGLALALAVVLAVGACTSDPEAADAPAPSSVAPSETDAAPAVRDMMDFELHGPIEPGTYFIDADLDPSTPLRVVYEIPAEAWSQWIGAAKFGPDDRHVAISITTVVDLVTDGCRDHLAADPPVGPTVDDLATALSELAPFEVTSPPSDVTVDGYHGKHLELTVPEMAFDRCDAGDLRSWIAPMDTAKRGDAFSGYTGPGYREEFWILDVGGTRLMIAAERSPGSPPEDLSELRAILDSIRIELPLAAEPYSRLKGEVKLFAAPPWSWICCFGPWHLKQGDGPDTDLFVLADPRPVDTGCRKGPAPADAEALAQSIRSDPDLETTAPVAASVGGVGALSIDVVAAPGASVCDWWNAPLVVTLTGAGGQAWASVDLEGGNRMRLYLLDLPEGLSARILAIAIVAPEARFEDVVESAGPIVDSFEFHAG